MTWIASAEKVTSPRPSGDQATDESSSAKLVTRRRSEPSGRTTLTSQGMPWAFAVGVQSKAEIAPSSVDYHQAVSFGRGRVTGRSSGRAQSVLAMPGSEAAVKAIQAPSGEKRGKAIESIWGWST